MAPPTPVPSINPKPTLNGLKPEVWKHILEGETDLQDALSLLRLPGTVLFQVADFLRSQAVGETVTYVVNRNINYTDHCTGTCRFCAFRERKGYILTLEEILDKTREAVEMGATEICIQGGLLPKPEIDYYLEMLRGIKKMSPSTHIHAFSPMEILHISQKNNLTPSETLRHLKKAGLDSMPGTAAEILVDRVRQKICPDKLTTNQWTEIIETAHKLGIPTTATIMYGHLETWQERIQHILLIRKIQQKTHGFTEFVPLPYLNRNNPLGRQVKKTPTPTENLKLHALARILLHPHIQNIQASWVKLGKKLAQKALKCGANDLGGTLIEEQISKSAGAKTGEYTSPQEFQKLIKEINRTPAQRDTLYNKKL